jgi:lipoprotein-anchoring transpeptidase ErfK/SrfK
MGVLTGGGFALARMGTGTASAAPTMAKAAPAGNSVASDEAIAAVRPRTTVSTRVSPTGSGTGKLALTAAERHACPAAASACVDLPAHLTWLQSDGNVTYGPVRMEPGPGAQGTAHATPLGTWTVQWKAGADYVSTTYSEAMPWATFFAPGGIAFHSGSLTAASHGCVHLSLANAKYFHDHLPIGAEVVVFSA